MPVSGPARIFRGAILMDIVFGPHPSGGVANTLVRGCTNARRRRRCIGGPVAINAGSRGDRPALHLPRLLHPGMQGRREAEHPDQPRAGRRSRAGAEIRSELHGRARRDEGRSRHRRSPTSTVHGKTHFQPSESRDRRGLRHRDAASSLQLGVVGVPRMDSPIRQRYARQVPDGRRPATSSHGRFDQLVRMYKAPPANAMTEACSTRPIRRRDFVRGFAVQTVGPLPIAFAKQMIAWRKARGAGACAS